MVGTGDSRICAEWCCWAPPAVSFSSSWIMSKVVPGRSVGDGMPSHPEGYQTDDVLPQTRQANDMTSANQSVRPFISLGALCAGSVVDVWQPLENTVRMWTIYPCTSMDRDCHVFPHGLWTGHVYYRNCMLLHGIPSNGHSPLSWTLPGFVEDGDASSSE